MELALDRTESRDRRTASSSTLKLAFGGCMALGMASACASLCLVFATLPAAAQIATGGVVGTVKDSGGSVVPDTELTLTNNGTAVAQTTRSTSTGTYVFNSVAVGNYSLRAAHPGFQDVLVQNIDVHIQVVLTQDVSLPVGSVSQQVTVSSAAPLLQAENATIGTTIGAREVVDLPLVSRDWASLAQLASGVTTANNQFAGGASQSSTGSAYFTIDGMNPWEIDFRLDGIDDNVELYGGAGPTFSNVNVTPPPDAIEEFRLQNGDFNAEFGHSVAGIINAVVHSGTNGLHGDLWEFVRNDAFDANDYFSKQANQPIPEYRQNQFGGTIGGPVVIPKLYNGRDKTFFFFDYQGSRYVTPSSYTSTVPTALMQSTGFTNLSDLIAYNPGTKTDALGRLFPYGTILDPATTRMVATGAVDPVSGIANTSGADVYVRDPFFNGAPVSGITDFTAHAPNLNMLPAGRLDPDAVKLLQLYPAQNKSGLANNYFISPKTPENINQYDIRIDENWRQHDTIFGVFDWSHLTESVPNRLPGIADGGNFGTGSISIPVYSIALGETHAFNATLNNEFHAGWNHNVQSQLSSNATQLGIPAQYGIQGVPEVTDNGGLTNFSISGFQSLGASGYMPTLGTITSLELMDNVTRVIGNHSFKAGMQFDRLYGIVLQSPYGRGQFTYSGQYSDVVNANTGQLGISDMLLTPINATVPNGINGLGSMSSFQASNVASNRDIRYYYGAYFQDDWKATPTLTFNLGLRWDHFTPYQEINGRQANFIQSGDGNGPAGTYYVPTAGCEVPRSPAFDALLAASNIAIACTSNKSTGNSQTMNFAPRLGFADRIKPNLVVRGGYGLAYGALSNIGFGGNLGVNYPFLYTNSFNSPNSFTQFNNNPGNSTPRLQNVLTTFNTQSALSVTPQGLNLQGRQYNFHTPYSQTFNLTIQDQIAPHDSIQAGYVGVVGRQLDGFGYHNSTNQILPPGADIYSYIPFPSFSPNSFYEVTNGTSSYNSLQATYQHQVSYGLNLLLNYTLSKCMTDQTFYANNNGSYRALWLPGFGARADYALCDTDSTHVVHASGEYALPFGRGKMFAKDVNTLVDEVIGGWAANFIYTFQTGTPFSVGCPVATTANFGCYANVVPGANIYAGGKRQQEWLNPAAFVNPPVATTVGQADYSPLGGNPFAARGPHFNNVDFSLFKQFSLPRETRLEFRAEAFNLFNTAEFGNPGNTSGFNNTDAANSNQFSTITSLRNPPRQLQFALKLYY